MLKIPIEDFNLNKKQLSFRIEEPTFNKLKSYSENMGVSQTKVIEDLLNNLFKGKILERREYYSKEPITLFLPKTFAYEDYMITYNIDVSENFILSENNETGLEADELRRYIISKVNNCLDVWDNKAGEFTATNFDGHEGLIIIPEYDQYIHLKIYENKYYQTEAFIISRQEALERAKGSQNRELYKKISNVEVIERPDNKEDNTAEVNDEPDVLTAAAAQELINKGLEDIKENLLNKNRKLYSNLDLETKRSEHLVQLLSEIGLNRKITQEDVDAIKMFTDQYFRDKPDTCPENDNGNSRNTD